MAGWERARPAAPLLMDIVHKMVCKRAAWSCVRQGVARRAVSDIATPGFGLRKTSKNHL